MRRAWTRIFLAAFLVVSGCGGGEMSMTEYTEQFNAITQTASTQYAEFSALPHGKVLLAQGAQLAEFTPQDLQAGLERIGQIENEILKETAAMDPPDQAAEFHELFFALSPYTAAREALAARAGTATNWEELSATPEMAAYRAAIADDKQACLDFAATIGTDGEESVFGDMPWIPSELKDAADSVLRCEDYPERPEDMYDPAASTP